MSQKVNADNPTLHQPVIQKIQRLGRLLSGMIMPNIGVYIAWGLLTALFIPTGWLPNATLARLIDPTVTYLIPILIGFTGGKIIYGHRGGVLAAMVTTGAIVGSSVTMIFGAMVIGPCAGWIIREFDLFVVGRVTPGFEMLINNFSGGILGGALAIGAYLTIGPAVEFLSLELGLLLQFVIDSDALFLTSLVIEPAKVLFLNNVVNHGVLGPLGVQQAAEAGASILFLLETNPGPGLGILLAYFVFARGTAKQSAPGAMLIHFFGGIHEVYFPYILMQPRLLLAAIGGGMSGVLTFNLLGAGLVAVPSPGSILAVLAMTPRQGLFAVLAGVLLSTLVTFILAALLIDRKKSASEDVLVRANKKMSEFKGKKATVGHDCIPDDLKEFDRIHLIAVACDAGMGSSAMSAGKLRATLAAAGVEMKVISCPIEQLASPIDLVITHERLTERAVQQFPDAVHIAVTDFIATPVYEELANRLALEMKRRRSDSGALEASKHPLLSKENIKLGLRSVAREDAIRLAGAMLYESGYVEEGYIEAMLEREQDFSTYIGNGVAIPHGTCEARSKIRYSGLCVQQFPDGVDFNGNTVYLVVGIAALGNQHLEILAELAGVLEDAAEMDRLRRTDDPDAIYRQFVKQSN